MSQLILLLLFKRKPSRRSFCVSRVCAQCYRQSWIMRYSSNNNNKINLECEGGGGERTVRKEKKSDPGGHPLLYYFFHSQRSRDRLTGGFLIARPISGAERIGYTYSRGRPQTVQTTRRRTLLSVRHYYRSNIYV